jgi:hypothetical protein
MMLTPDHLASNGYATRIRADSSGLVSSRDPLQSSMRMVQRAGSIIEGQVSQRSIPGSDLLGDRPIGGTAFLATLPIPLRRLACACS